MQFFCQKEISCHERSVAKGYSTLHDYASLMTELICFNILSSTRNYRMQKRLWYFQSGLYVPIYSFMYLFIFTLHIMVTCIKENTITKLQKFYSLSRNLRVGEKSPTLFLKKSLCTRNLLPAHKIFIEKPVNSTLYNFKVTSATKLFFAIK